MNDREALIRICKILQAFAALQVNLSRSTAAVAEAISKHIPNWQAEYVAAQASVSVPDTLLQFQAEINRVLLSLGEKLS
jgi:hypothetical protein